MVDLVKRVLSITIDVEVSQRIRAKVYQSEITKGDILLIEHQGGYVAGRLWLCVSVESELICFVSAYTLICGICWGLPLDDQR